ncbi:MAG: hypothetical protein IJ041_02725 [Clostridia bacterium]|nr:hypothetical protein [Clostridia bacterium]
MNGLANAILTLLLSWLRSIISSVWKLLSSESGSRLYQFLAGHWLLILLILAVGGYILDRIIYVIRWRPHWVRRNRKLQQLADQDTPITGVSPQPTWQPAAAETVWPQPAPMPQPEPMPQPFVQPMQQPATPWVAGDTRIYGAEPAQEQTNIYAGLNRNPYTPRPEDIDPVFDEEMPSWETDEPLFPAQPAKGVSARYVQDMNAGFARPLPPEQLYGTEPQPDEQVHPGLDVDVFRRNIGLGEDGQPETRYSEPLMQEFTPFTRKAEPAETSKKSRNPFLNLMKLMGDDDNRPTIHDLQNNVDVRTAFHEPVFPQQTYHTEEDA